MKKITILTIMLLTALTAYAADEAGKVTGFEGKVLVYDSVSPRPADVTEKDTPVYMGGRVATKRSSKALVSFVDGDAAALDENSILTVEDQSKYKPGEGKVVFSIKKRGQASGVTVALTSAVIGVKGTKFLINTDEKGKNQVYLKEGEIEVTALAGQFKKYNAVVMDEYEAYVRKMTGEYEDYLKKLQEEYVEYVKNFLMEPGMAYSIDGNEVRKLEFTPEINKAFEILDEFK